VTRLDFPGLALAASQIRRTDPFSDFPPKSCTLINRVTFHLPPRGVFPRWGWMVLLKQVYAIHPQWTKGVPRKKICVVTI
jgi:hypothetical protein